MSCLNEKVCIMQSNVVNKRTTYKDSLVKYEYQNNEIELDVLKRTNVEFKDDILEERDIPEVKMSKELIDSLKTNQSYLKRLSSLEDRIKNAKCILKQISNEKKCKITSQINAINELL